MFFLPQLRFSARSRLLPACGAILLLCLAVNADRAVPITLSPRLITLPAGNSGLLFVDIDGNGRADLLVIDPVEKKLLNYLQRPDGFGNSPDQSIPLPPQTAWVAPCDVDAHPDLELLFSTPTGLVYSRQNAGLFESERHTLIEASQVFSNFDFPILTRLGTNNAGTNVLIPVVLAGQAVLYYKDNVDKWIPGSPLALDAKGTSWQMDGDSWWGSSWALGPNPGHSLRVQQVFLPKPDTKQDEEPENETIRKISDDMKKRADSGPPRTVRMDVNGDGREDLVLWQVSGRMDTKTEIYVFLRGTDQKLPERPTQILHCRGFPIPTGSTSRISPVIDLNGDGICELVLLEIKSSFTSASGALETALSHGIDWALTIRPFHNGAFSRSPEASVVVTGLLSAEASREWPIFILGDFNGDGRPDLFFRRSETRWNIYFSTTDGSWFSPQPAMTFETPDHGYIEIKDLNGGGLSDIIWNEPEEHRLSIFMSPPRQTKGKNP
jgi:hypothetical protein